MRITLNNIENFINFFKNNQRLFSVNNIEWVDPIFVTMMSAYLKDTNNNFTTNNSYINNMLNTVYQDNKTYTPIEQILTRNDIDEIAAHLTTIMLKNFSFLTNEDLKDLKHYLHYLFSELMNNVADHSNSQIGGFAMAQYYPNSKKIQFSISDRGIGFLKNIKLKYNVNSEEEAILKALERGITASYPRLYGQERNAGYGLFAMKTILEETGGVFVIISNDTLIRYSNGNIKVVKLANPWKGVVVAFEFYEDKINFSMEDFKRNFLWQDSDIDEEFF